MCAPSAFTAGSLLNTSSPTSFGQNLRAHIRSRACTVSMRTSTTDALLFVSPLQRREEVLHSAIECRGLINACRVSCTFVHDLVRA